MSILRRIGFSLILALWASGAWAACGTTSLTFKDAAGATQTLCFGGTAGSFLGQTQIVDGSDNAVSVTSNALNTFITGGSIANTTFAVTNAGTFAVQDSNLSTAISAGKVNINVSSGAVTANAGTNLNTSALALSANQTNASQKTQIVDGSGNVIASTSNNLDVQCANCSGSGVSTADEATFTAGASLFAGAGGFFQTTATSNALTNGQQGEVQLTANRAFMVNLRTAAGVETGIAAAPLQVSLANTAANATGVKTLVFGNGAATLDAPVGNSTAPTNMLAVGGVFNSAPLTLTNTQSSALQLDSKGALEINCFANCGLAQGSTTASEIGSLVMGAVTTGAPSYTTAQTSPVSLDVNGNTRVLSDGGCAGQGIAATNYTPFSLASTTALKVITLASSKQVYICSINIVSAAANNVALIDGTKVTTDCDTSTHGMAGGTTAATGWNFAANGGLVMGNGQGIVARTATAAHDVCLLASGSGQLSGGITWAQY